MRRVHGRKAVALAVSLAFGTDAANAATLTVTSADDDFGAGSCNLRNTLAAASAGFPLPLCPVTGNFGDNDTIVFAPQLVNAKITLERGQLFVAGNFALQGSGQTIDANFGSRVMYIAPGASLTASNLTLTHGYGGPARHDGAGAGLYVNGGSANLTNVTISHNIGFGEGAGIYVSASPSVTLSHCTVSDNATTRSRTGGISVYASYININDSVVTGNLGQHFGGIALFAGYEGDGYSGSSIPAGVRLSRSTVSGNFAGCTQDVCAGGIYGGYATDIEAVDSTISGNSGVGNIARVAGGIYSGSVYSGGSGKLSLLNTTVSGNIAHGTGANIAGAVWLADSINATLTNVTISANSGADYATYAPRHAGVVVGYVGDNTKMAIVNSIIAGNNGSSDLAVSATSAVGATSSIIGVNVGVSTFSPNVNNQFNVITPGLGPLQNNGGPTSTMALLAGSPAIDIGNPAFTPPNYDQRGIGFARVFNAAIDAGAVEFQGDRIFAASFEAGP